jgi:uncharacterized protein YjbI with pentapeptide repeats
VVPIRATGWVLWGALLAGQTPAPPAITPAAPSSSGAAADAVQKRPLSRASSLAEGEDWRGRDLRGSQLNGVALTQVRLEGADARASQWVHVDLRRADLRRVRVGGAVWSFVDLRGADLRDTDLSGLLCVGCRLGGARINRATVLPADWGPAQRALLNVVEAP